MEILDTHEIVKSQILPSNLQILDTHEILQILDTHDATISVDHPKISTPSDKIIDKIMGEILDTHLICREIMGVQTYI